jgi:hypothetical protein
MFYITAIITWTAVMTKPDQILLRSVLHSPLVQTSLHLDDSAFCPFSTPMVTAIASVGALVLPIGAWKTVEWGSIKRIKDIWAWGREEAIPYHRLG